jgi:hypothetical protein
MDSDASLVCRVDAEFDLVAGELDLVGELVVWPRHIAVELRGLHLEKAQKIYLSNANVVHVEP